jgi:hypothetical protein
LYYKVCYHMDLTNNLTHRLWTFTNTRGKSKYNTSYSTSL